MRLREWLVAVCLAAMLTAPVIAQNQMVIDRIKALDASAPVPSEEAILKDLKITAGAYAEAKKQCPPTALNVKSVAPITGARAILSAVLSGQLKNGWSIMVEQSGCGNERLVRYALVQKADGSLLSVRTNEGKSNANLSIMRDTSASAALGAYAAIKKIDASCAGENPVMGETRIMEESADLGPEIYGVRYTGSWVEIWPFSICGRTAEVTVSFRADGDGGAYTNIAPTGVVVLAASK